MPRHIDPRKILTDLIQLPQEHYDWVIESARIVRRKTPLKSSLKRMERRRQSVGLSEVSSKSLSLTSPAFDSAWALWPRHVSKQNAYKEWVKNDCDQISERVISAIKAQRYQLTKSGLEFCPHFSTWLHAHRWEDVIQLSVSTGIESTFMHPKEFVMPEKPVTDPEQVKGLLRDLGGKL